MLTTITIPHDEWRAAEALLSLITHDETAPIGQVRLRCDGHVRRWYATDSFRAAFTDGGGDTGLYDVGLSPSLVRFAVALGDDVTDVDLHIDTEDDETRIGVVTAETALWTDDLGYSYPAIEAKLAADADDIAGTATIDAVALHQLVVSARTQRQSPGDDGEPAPVAEFWIGIADGEFQASVDWPDCGSSQFTLRLDDAQGDVLVQVDPRLLQTLIELFSPGEALRLTIPRYNAQPVVLAGTSVTAMLMPIRNEAARRREQVEATINEVCGHLAVIPDDDGDYPLQRRSTPVFGRLTYDREVPVLQVFAVVLSGIEASAELMAELNDLNASSAFARLFHIGDQVLAEVDLAAATLDPYELDTAIRRIHEVAQTVIPTLAAVLGGELIEDPAVGRLRLYRDAVIEAEIMPGSLVAINGPDASEWVFPGSVHVITGWNPQGISLGDQSHHDINVQIADDILRRGGRFVHGQGRSESGHHAEPSLVAWGITRYDAVDMGRRANQDAIFEVDADEVRLVSCVDGTVHSWPRR